MTFQVLRMQVSLGAMRARKLAIGILDWDNGVLGGAGSSCRSCRATRSAGQNASSALRTNNVSRLLGFAQDAVLLHHRARAVGRRDAVRAHETTGGHRAQDRRTTSTWRRGSDGLRVRRRGGSTLHHGLRGAVASVRRVWILSHRVHAASGTSLRALGVAGRQVMRRVGRVRRTSARGVRVATVEGLHARGGRLQRRQRLRQRRTWLAVMRRKRRWRRVAVRVGGTVYTIGGIGRVIHAIARRDASKELLWRWFLWWTVVGFKGERASDCKQKTAIAFD